MRHSQLRNRPPSSVRLMSRTFRRLICLFFGTLFLGLPGSLLAQHRHINAGAASPSPGSPLQFANGALFNADSGFLIHLNPLNHLVYGSIFFGGSDVTFTSLPATLNNGGPDPSAALPGTHVEMIFESVQGPAGGAFSCWDSFDGFFDATEITFSVPSGSTGGTNRFILSENDGSPGVDPYGHIHGRKFSVNRPGIYTVGVRLVDTGNNGPGGTPLHAASDLIFFNFVAGIVLADVRLNADNTVVRFGTDTGVNYWVESSSELGVNAAWKSVAGPISGTGRLESVTLPGAPAVRAFYRLRTE